MADSDDANLRQKVNFYVSCRNLAKTGTFSKSDPFCEVMVKKVPFVNMLYICIWIL